MASARIIQKTWKAKRCYRLVQQLNRRQKDECAVTIQKMLRGYMARAAALQVLKARVAGVSAYFEEMREKYNEEMRLEVSSAIYIAYRWRKFLRQRARRRSQKRGGGVGGRGGPTSGNSSYKSGLGTSSRKMPPGKTGSSAASSSKRDSRAA